jgi:sugar transferase (PEP-CTERM/EpsH1 system associated)
LSEDEMIRRKTRSILVLSSRIPFPLIGGDRIRIYNFGVHLSQHYNIDLLALHEGELDKNTIAGAERAFRRVFVFNYPRIRFLANALRGFGKGKALQVAYYGYEEVQSWIDRHMGEYDGIFANHIRMSPYVEDRKTLKWVDLHDAISFNYSTAIDKKIGIWRFAYRYENRRVLADELKAIKKFEKTFIVSSRDKNFLAKQGCDADRIVVAPVAVPDQLLEKKIDEAKDDNICFIGKMDTVANVDSACYFAEEIFPLIRRKRPRSRFLIVGAVPARKVRNLARFPGVEVTGWVNDPYKIVGMAKVVVAPMRIGAGMQNKILEAMALGKTVVTTSLAADGIGGRDGEHYLIADSPLDCTEIVLQILSDAEMRKCVGWKAKQWVKEHHTWSVLAELFHRELGESLKLIS